MEFAARAKTMFRNCMLSFLGCSETEMDGAVLSNGDRIVELTREMSIEPAGWQALYRRVRFMFMLDSNVTPWSFIQ